MRTYNFKTQIQNYMVSFFPSSQWEAEIVDPRAFGIIASPFMLQIPNFKILATSLIRPISLHSVGPTIHSKQIRNGDILAP